MTLAQYAVHQRVRIEAPGITATGEVRSVVSLERHGTDGWCYMVAFDDGRQMDVHESYLSPMIRFREFL